MSNRTLGSGTIGSAAALSERLGAARVPALPTGARPETASLSERLGHFVRGIRRRRQERAAAHFLALTGGTLSDRAERILMQNADIWRG